MGVMTSLVIIAVGVAVGLLSGLVGIGGGVLIVPFLYFFYDRPDLFGVIVSPEARVVLAHGTSLFVIMPTAVRGALAFHRSGLVAWSAVWPIGAGSVVAALGGARLAAVLPPELLKSLFGTLLILSGVQLLFRKSAPPTDVVPEAPRLSLWVTFSVGLVVGLMSALLGVGGGIIAIPMLIYLVKLDIRQVAATSIGIIGLTASSGTIGYVLTGMGQPGLPPWSLGYVHVSAGLVMFLGAAFSVRWGAALNQRLKPRALAMMFGGLFVLLGLRLVGANLVALLTDAAAMVEVHAGTWAGLKG
jgi:uncharacterized protein